MRSWCLGAPHTSAGGTRSHPGPQGCGRSAERERPWDPPGRGWQGWLCHESAVNCPGTMAQPGGCCGVSMRGSTPPTASLPAWGFWLTLTAITNLYHTSFFTSRPGLSSILFLSTGYPGHKGTHSGGAEPPSSPPLVHPFPVLVLELGLPQQQHSVWGECCCLGLQETRMKECPKWWDQMKIKAELPLGNDTQVSRSQNSTQLLT